MGGPEFPRGAAFPSAEPVLAANPARQLSEVFDTSDSWEMGGWSGPALVVSRAALKHMLSLVEKEMGKRGMMPVQRGGRS